ncbi:malto-oligosyltrehalose trehalohydrolase [Novosphingobium endophyticum]|uniref:Malto-oligosyltrehalose trehalohydrolase n=1 Tax=Novosphingobium endophyticum TaxID=1955250 RepID=A0A916TT42_9SPHN|nr:malto-oligosyltrehalose trehalohydrolase [Novosphingobium endophyticum]GGC05154.1 malto-oligosyltrehalose trehalohydrolase [Novosphingobium endophyticum]
MNRWGPLETEPGLWRFRLWSPAARNVDLEVEGQRPLAMQREADGWLSAEAEARPGTRYRFVLADGTAVPDPASRGQSGGVHGWSVVTAPNEYAWRNPHWQGRPWQDAVIMELHAGVMGGFAGIEAELERLAGLGITAVELMPLGAFSGTRNWGYDGVLPFAPAECYGTPADLMRLIDRAHGLGLMVLVDVVYNHFGPDGNYLGLYAPGFFHAGTDTPWGGAVAVEKAPVADFFLENALMWLTDYRVDGLRFDAVHAIGDTQFLDWLAREIRGRAAADRHIHLILENAANDAQRLRQGCYTAQWNDDFHNVLHVILTGETEAYYADFAGRPTERLARCLAEGFIYQGEPSPSHAGKLRGTPSGHLPPTAFVAFLQNHDQVGNRAMGERLITLTDTARLRAAMALLLLCPQIPLLFMGEENGSRTPFLFFTDFHDELADAVREGRRREFANFAAFRDKSARARIPDPNDAATFDASRPEPGPDADAWNAFIRSLLELRSKWIAPRLEGTMPMGAEVLGTGAVVASWRLGDGQVLTLAVNLGKEPVASFPGRGTPIFAVGSPGAAGSLAAWLEPA